MNKEEYYKRIEKINNRFKTDRVSADEEYQHKIYGQILPASDFVEVKTRQERKKESQKERQRKYDRRRKW